jgi:CBS domain-containing protein
MTADVVCVEIPGNRDDVLRILKRTGISGVPVLKEGKLVGIITRKDLLRTPDPVTIQPDAPLREAAIIMAKHNVRRLPVVEAGKLLGLISVADLIGAIAQMKIEEEIKSRFTCPTFAVWEETPLPLIGRIMEISSFDAIPILNEDSQLTGIISERDLIRHACIEDSVQVSDFSNGTDDDEWTWESIRDMHSISYGISRIQLPNKPAKAAMIRDVVAMPVNSAISECALKMKRARIDQMPVINGDKRLVSMLFDRNLIRVLIPDSVVVGGIFDTCRM